MGVPVGISPAVPSSGLRTAPPSPRRGAGARGGAGLLGGRRGGLRPGAFQLRPPSGSRPRPAASSPGAVTAPACGPDGSSSACARPRGPEPPLPPRRSLGTRGSAFGDPAPGGAAVPASPAHLLHPPGLVVIYIRVWLPADCPEPARTPDAADARGPAFGPGTQEAPYLGLAPLGLGKAGRLPAAEVIPAPSPTMAALARPPSSALDRASSWASLLPPPPPQRFLQQDGGDWDAA